MLVLAYRSGGGFLLLRWTGIRRPAPARLRAIAEAASERMGIRARSIEVLAPPYATAPAYPLSRRIVVTDAALAVFGDDELSAVCAHELAHMSEPRRVALARVLFGLTPVVWIALAVLGASLTDPFVALETGLALIVGIEWLWPCGAVVYHRLHRRMEVLADAMACRFEGEPGT